jgi:hypothetical protein
MRTQHHDTTSSPRQGWRVLLRLAAVTAAAFALVAASVSAAPPGLKTSSDGSSPAASAAATATTCAAQIQKGSQLVPVYERYYKFVFKKIKGTGKYRKVIVQLRRKMQVSCTRACVRTKVKKKKRVPVYTTVRRTVTVKKGNRLVKVKKKVRVYVFEKCKINTNSSSGTPVKIKILDGSKAVLDFGAFIREAGLSGDLSGFIPGGYKLNQDNQISLTRGTIGLGVTDVFIDDACAGQVSSSIRTNQFSGVTLDPTRSSTSTVLASGGVTATAYTRIKLALDMRNDDSGCNQPYISTGYQEFAKTFFFKGAIQKGTGLNKLALSSAPDPLDVEACLSPGTPTSPCNGFAIPLPIIVSVKLTVQVQIG